MAILRNILVGVAAMLLFATPAFAADQAEVEYQSGSKCFHEVRRLPAKEQSRAKWHKCVTIFEGVTRKYPKSARSDDSLFSSGLSYRRLYEISENVEDAKDAIGKFSDLVRMYPKSNLSDDALFNIATLKAEATGDKNGAKKALEQLISWYSGSDMVEPAEKYLKSLTGGKGLPETARTFRGPAKYIRLTGIERKTGQKGESLKISLTGKPEYTLDESKHSVPNHLKFTLDLENTILTRMMDLGYSYTDNKIIRDINPSQVDRQLARIEIVVKDGNTCKVVPENNNLNLICRPGSAEKLTASIKNEVPMKTERPANTVTGDRALVDANEVKSLTVVIDAGHGGDDEGAVGPNGTREKDIVLQIAKRLGWRLRNQLGMNVYYTRIDDRYITLDDRNAVATGYNADLFISIHANASESSALDGYQTFFLNNATDEASKRLASRENASIGKSMDDLEKIILTMMQNENTDESRDLAKSIHKKVLSSMSKYALKDRGIKSALFYVLVGSKCPAVLVETSFISNPDEEKKLKDPAYQESIATSIAEGIRDYLVNFDNSKTNL